MLDEVQCKVLSVIEGEEVDAYLLRCVCRLSVTLHADELVLPLPCAGLLAMQAASTADPPFAYPPRSESSMFVWPHKLILKTCGTTTLLLGIPTLLRIASETCGFKGVWRCFYSRKTFMFPDRQRGPHKDWNAEMAFLDKLFGTLRCLGVGEYGTGRAGRGDCRVFPICRCTDRSDRRAN